MSISLFRHNEEAYNKVVKMLSEYNKAAVIHPTGSGKSYIAFKIVENNPDKKFVWVAPSEYIFYTQIENIRDEVPEDFFDTLSFIHIRSL